MEYVYATLLLDEAGEEINETNLTAVLEAASVGPSESRVKAIVAALEGVDISDVTDSGMVAKAVDDGASGASEGLEMPEDSETPEDSANSETDGFAPNSEEDEREIELDRATDTPESGDDSATGPEPE